MGDNWVANPSTVEGVWFVWNMTVDLPVPRFFGTMEECGLVADALNAEPSDG